LSRPFRLNCVISFIFYLYLMLHTCVQRFDMTGNLKILAKFLASKRCLTTSQTNNSSCSTFSISSHRSAEHQVPQTLPQQYAPSQQKTSTQQPIPNPQILVQQLVYTSQAPPVVSTVMTSALRGMGVKQQQGAMVEQQQITGKRVQVRSRVST
jgi:hypothetical protein